MKKELVNEFVSKLEANMKSIEKVIKENLGVDIKMRIVTSGRYDINVKLEEFESDVSTKVLTSHPLLRQLFKESCIVLRAWPNEGNICTFLVEVCYEHNFRGGSNGHDLMMFDMDLTTGKVIEICK